MTRRERVSGLLILLVAAAPACGRSNGGHPSGTLEATEIDITAGLPAQVKEVPPRLGDRVARGDTLVILDTELLALERAQAAANRRSISVQRRLGEEDLRQAQTGLALAETTLARARILLEQGSTPRQAVDDLTARRDVSLIQVRAAREKLELFEAEEAKLTAALAVFDRELEDGVLTAPADGTVLVRSVEPGERVVPGIPVMRIADLRRLELRVYLGEEDLDLVRLGQTVPVRVDALGDEEIRGTVTWIGDEAEFTPKNVQTRNARAQLVFAVKVEIENPDGRLHIGMPAEVRL
jgi:HlyD family secretion protein